MNGIKNILGKSLLFVGLFVFTGVFGQTEYKLDAYRIKNATGIPNDKDLEEAANNAIDQIRLKTKAEKKKLEEKNPGSISSNIVLSMMRKADSLTNTHFNVVQYISEKCYSDKGWENTFFLKNMNHLGKMRDTILGHYFEFMTGQHTKSKYKFNPKKFDIENPEKGIKKLMEQDQKTILKLLEMRIEQNLYNNISQFNSQMAYFRMIQLEYFYLQYVVAKQFNGDPITDIQNDITSVLKSEYDKILAFREEVRKDSIRKAEEKAKQDSIANAKRNRTYHVVGVGDMMLGTNFPNESYLPPANQKLLDPVKEYLQNADCTFGNLEGTVLDKGGDVKHCSNPSICYAFRMPEKYVDEIKEAGFDLISVANNHVGDFGESGRKNTTQVLTEKGFCFSGLLSRPWDTTTIDGVKYGLISFSPNTGTVRINNYPVAKKLVQELDKMCDIVVVSFHGGAEGSKHQHMPKQKEIFYGENRGNVYEFAHMMIDNGADIVFGHGPHVTRAIDVYKDRFITYSMGNFCTYHRFNLSGVSGMAPIFDIEVDGEGKFIKGRVISTRQYGEGGPVIDSKKNALRLVKELTASDVPEVKLKWEGEYFMLEE